MKRRKLIISIVVVLAGSVAAVIAFAPRVPPDGFALKKSPVKFQYYSRASFDLKPMIDIPLPGGNRFQYPKPPPAHLKQHLEGHDRIGGVLVLHGLTKHAHWSPIIFQGISGYQYYPSNATVPATQELPVPYGRSKERREGTINIEGSWRTVTLPEPPPGKDKPPIRFNEMK